MIVVATTLTGFAMASRDTWEAWLFNAKEVRASHPEGVRFFAAIETDARGREMFRPLVDRLAELDGDCWWFGLDDGRETVHTLNRLRHIALGENLAVDYATATGASHLLFCAADCAPPPDVLPRLLEMDAPLCGPEIPTYCLSGQPVYDYPFPVHDQLISAACILIRRDVFKVLRWRYDPDEGMSDDPAYRRDAEELLGVRSLVRKDIRATHYPEAIGPIETRFPGRDMTVHR